MEYTDNFSYFTIFVGTIGILVNGVHCPVKHNFSSCGFPIARKSTHFLFANIRLKKEADQQAINGNSLKKASL